MAQHRQANFGYLLTGLLIVLFLAPVSQQFADQSLTFVTSIGFSATLIVGIWSLSDSRRLFRIGMAMVILDVILTVISLFQPSPIVDTLSLLTALAFCSMSLAIALRHVLFDQRMDLNRMIGGICVYLLLGITIAILNIFIYRFIPDSFNGMPDIYARSSATTLIYYSFVTMTTLGYGDITPAGQLARVVAYLAAVAGQFYIAILVGTLVGMYLSQRNNDDEQPPG
jgi:voltage-gated potassium channel